MSTISSNSLLGERAQASVFFHLVKESRPIVLALAAMRFAAGGLMSTDGLPGPGVAVAGLAWLLVTAGIYLTNASSDIVADTINEKQRPLAQGLLTKQQVDVGAICSFAGAAFLGSFVGPAFLAITAVMGTIGVLYSIGPKPGKNHFLSTALIVAAGICLPYAGGSLAVHGDVRQASLIAGIVCGSWAAVAGVSKDFADLAGDKADGRRTLPVVLGLRVASRIAAGGSTAIAFLALGCALNVPHLGALWALAAGAFAFAAACVALSLRQNAPVSVGKPYRVFMMTQISANSAMIVMTPALTLASS